MPKSAFSVKKSWKKYGESLQFLAGGSSTNSKRPTFKDFEPALIVRGKGCRVWDLDGNEYIDFRNSLGPITLGYNVPEINSAIIKQLKSGIIFGHPHPLEGEVAKLLAESIPCAEKVRFLKTGGEAISACIKIVRNATGRNKILQCGYNGWLNCLSSSGNQPVGIASSRPDKGVPPTLQALHKSLPWGNLNEWEKVLESEGNEIAAVVIASSYGDMEKGKEFLPALRKLTEKYGTLMIMDEIVTGFRLAIGGAHEYFNFKPDMAVFAKGMANGMPLSAYLGRKDLLDSAPEIAISSTYGGETLSLAAAKATVEFYHKNRVIDYLWKIGKKTCDGIKGLFKKYDIQADLLGFPVCAAFSFASREQGDLFYKLCYKNGVSFYSFLYVNYSHKEKDIDEVLTRVERAIKEMKK